jgi:hypothetical protein
VEYPDISGATDVFTGRVLENPVCKTSIMSRLVLPYWMNEIDIFVGMMIRPDFNRHNPTGRVTDMWYVPDFTKEEWESKIKPSVQDTDRASNSQTFWRDVPSKYRNNL